MAHAQLPHTLTIGKREQINVRDLADASSAYAIARMESGEGASTWPDGRITIDSKTYRITYNGRVWDGKTCIMEAQ